METSLLEALLLDELGYSDSHDLNRSPSWRNGRGIPNVNCVFSIRNTQVAYFARLADADPQHLWLLQRSVWNESKIPLLYVILPQEIRIYNGYAQPAENSREFVEDHEDRLLRHLKNIVDIETARRLIRRELLDTYDRIHLETGSFWATPDGQKIKRQSRADQKLLRSMGQLRRHLVGSGISNSIAYSFIGRAILIRYLQDRSILSVKDICEATNNRYDSFLNALNSISATNSIFQSLTKRFKGDLFPLEAEELESINEDHLELLKRFLSGEDLDSGQLSFWPYDFRYIPIELISGIYDTFFKSTRRRELGAFYTPIPLVDFILDETLPIDGLSPDLKVLDPACGSGVFLVRAFQRLVNACHRKKGRRLAPFELKRILQQQIYGVDKAPEAIRIAIFSLYIALLDYLTNEQINNKDFEFPKLKGSNLLEVDFFSDEVSEHFGGMRFNRIIGNPPWGKSTLKGEALSWVEESNVATGGGQLAQAFLWRAPEFCSHNGEIALLAPAKSTVLVTSQTHEEFRRDFFSNYDVRAVVNFSALVYELFPDSLSPSVAVFYHPSKPSSDQSRLVYATPKPSLFSQHMGAILLESTEIKFLTREELLSSPLLWKVAIWGTPRDAAFISRLNKQLTLKKGCEVMGWEPGEGMQINGGDENPAPWAPDIPFLDTDAFKPFVLDLSSPVYLAQTTFHRPRPRERYQGPLVLIHQSRCQAAYSPTDVLYLHSITGINGSKSTEPYLKWLVAYINSPLARYYQFLTSARWAVERGNPVQEEYLRMPFALPEQNDPRFRDLVDTFDEITRLENDQESNHLENHQHPNLFDTSFEECARLKAIIDDLVFELFGLSKIEKQLVSDIVTHEIDFFNWSKRKTRKPGQSTSVKSPDLQMLKDYAETFIETVSSLLKYQKQTLNGVIFKNGSPLTAIGFEVVNEKQAKGITINEGKVELRRTLRHLDKLLLNRQSENLFIRRHVRIYDENYIYLVRPNERRFWTQSQSRVDADGLILEWLARDTMKTEGVA